MTILTSPLAALARLSARPFTRPFARLAALVALSITPLLAAAQPASANAPAALPQARGDEAILEMQQAFRKGDRKRLAALLPQLRGHALEPWAAYWELRNRLDEASPQEVQDFYARYPDSYHEDRLRNDWLLLLGSRRDWSNFAAEVSRFRMGDDREVRCYALIVEHIATGREVTPEVLRQWVAQREADDGCTYAVDRLYSEKKLPAVEVWRKVRMAVEANRPRAARAALDIVAPDSAQAQAEVMDNPARYLSRRVGAPGKAAREMVVLALVRMAANDADAAAAALDSHWSVHLSPEQRAWAWGAVGKAAAQRLDPDALGYFDNARDRDLSDDHLAWKVRAALRAAEGARSAPAWKVVQSAVEAMSDEARRDPTWTYWLARSLGAQAEAAREPQRDALRARARQLLESIASVRGFYEQLALEDLGRPIVLPAAPEPLSAAEREAARRNASLNRGLYAILIGLRSEGVREWNYGTNLHQRGGMNDRELLAAAAFACEREVWDRCINTSDRTREVFDATQRYPMPFREQVLRRAAEIGLDPAFVYGLIRQESRFVMDARSHVGASGLMQVMPATARWTARKIGLTGFTAEQINDRDTNIAIGTGYLKLVLDDFEGSNALAAAAYNAGPSRARAWRRGPLLEAAIWAETVPFTETRDYVKKVLANANLYAALISAQPQSLKGRLGRVGPRDAAAAPENRDLP